MKYLLLFRSALTWAALMPCALGLAVPSALAAQAQGQPDRLDEKIYDPGQRPGQVPQVPQIPQVPGQRSPSTPPGVTVIPGQSAPGITMTPGVGEPVQPDRRIIVPEGSFPGPIIPSAPSTPAAPPVPIVPYIPRIPESVDTPAVPPSPGSTPDTIIVVPDQHAPTTPVTPPKAEERTLLTPADFLPTTPTPEAKPAEPRADKSKPEPDKTRPDPKSKPNPADPAKSDPKAAPSSPQKGQALRVPPDAGKTGNMDFLEGCWRGRLSGRRGNETTDNMGSRFCFDKNGKGKHFLNDPKLRETCVGSANGGMSPDGTLRVDFGDLYCPSGDVWHPQGEKYMTCREEGGQTTCYWYYPGGQRSVTGPFYRD